MAHTSLVLSEASSEMAATYASAAGSPAGRYGLPAQSSLTGPLLLRAVDSDPRNLNSTQLATLQAICSLFARCASSDLPARHDAVASQTFRPSPPPIAFDYRLALDELELICRTRAGYAFTELPFELQEAVVSLIISRDLATPKIDLALWLEVLRRKPSAASGTSL